MKYVFPLHTVLLFLTIKWLNLRKLNGYGMRICFHQINISFGITWFLPGSFYDSSIGRTRSSGVWGMQWATIEIQDHGYVHSRYQWQQLIIMKEMSVFGFLFNCWQSGCIQSNFSWQVLLKIILQKCIIKKGMNISLLKQHARFKT